MGGFSGSSYPIKTAEIEGLRDVANLPWQAMASDFGTTLVVNGLEPEIAKWPYRIKYGLFSVNPYTSVDRWF